MNQKLSLNDLQVQSFITTLNQSMRLRAGNKATGHNVSLYDGCTVLPPSHTDPC